MTKLALALATSILVLAACASGPMATTSSNTTMASLSGEQFCWKRILAEKDGKLYCNWVSDLSKACLAERSQDYSTAVEMDRFSAPQAAGRCENGNYLVRVQPRNA
jgi:hypothetical protein